MPKPPQVYPPEMFLMGLLLHWPLSDNGFPPPDTFTHGLLMGLPVRILGLPSDRNRLLARPKEIVHVSPR